MVKKPRTYRSPKKTRRGKRQPSDNAASKTSSSSDDGFSLAIFFLLIAWFLGFVSFHSPSEKKTRRKLADVSKELLEAQEHLAKLQNDIEATKEAIEPLEVQKEAIELQISQLEATRNALSTKLSDVSELIDAKTDGPKHWFTWFTNIGSGVVANAIWALITIVLGLLGWRRFFRRRKLATEPDH